MKKSLYRSIAVICVLIFMMIQFCSCACDNGGNGGPDATEAQAQNTDVPGGSDVTDPDSTAEATPGQSGESTTPAPGVTTEPGTTPGADDTPAATEPTGSAEATANVTPANSGSPNITPTPSPTPGPTASGATPTPSNAPTPVTGLVWFDDSAPVYYDLDFDGKPEKVELKLTPVTSYAYSCMLKITVGSNGKELADSFTTEYFTKALINDFNSGDNRAEIMICGGTGNKDHTTKACRLNHNSTALDKTSISGWIETVTGNNIEIGRYVDIMGTWACSAVFNFSRSDFSLVQQSAAWQVHRDSERWCTVSRDFLVTLYIDNSQDNNAGFLYTGDRIYPTSTDLSSYIEFVSDLGDRGSITITKGSGGEYLLNQEPIGNWFSDLEYID